MKDEFTYVNIILTIFIHFFESTNFILYVPFLLDTNGFFFYNLNFFVL